MADLRDPVTASDADVTTQSRIARAIARRERELSDFLDHLTTGLHSIGPDGRILWANRAELDMLGFTEEEYVGHHVSEFHVDQDLVADIIRRVTGGETLRDCPATLRRKDGSIRHVLISSNALIQDGEFIYSRCVTRDVTGEYEALRSLRERDAVLGLALRGARLGVWTHELASGRVRWSPELEELFGVAAGSFAGSIEAFLDLIHPDDRAAFSKAIDDALTGKRDLLIEFRFAHAGGDWRWMEGRGQTLFDDRGNPLTMCCVGLDVTERKRSETALRRSEQLYRAVGESIDFGIWVCDAEGRNIYASDSFLKLVGITQKECSEFGWGDVLHPEDSERTIAAWRECVRIGGVWDIEHRFRGPDGRYHPVLARGVPVRDEHGNIICWAGINLDIGRLKIAETALREADRRKNEFLAVLAHELRNPLAPISYALAIIRQHGRSASEAKRAEEVIERQLAQLSRLLDDLLDVTRITRGTLELRRTRIDLAATIDAAVETARPLIESRGHTFTCELPDEPVRLHADGARLAEVFANLLINAAKYTEAGGRIALQAKTEGHEVTVSVRDNGMGIAPEMMPRLFTLFAQHHDALERSDGGLGVGLALARDLVKLHGGTIEARSEGLARGSEFIVRLPIDAHSLQAPDANDRAAPRAAARSLRVLIADDNRDSAETCATLLRLNGHEVHTAHTGREALEHAHRLRPDVALLDIGMPELSGYEVAARIRAAGWGQHIRLIAVTGWGNAEDVRRSREAGFEHHLTKPVDPSALESVLASAATAGASPTKPSP